MTTMAGVTATVAIATTIGMTATMTIVDTAVTATTAEASLQPLPAVHYAAP